MNMVFGTIVKLLECMGTQRVHFKYTESPFQIPRVHFECKHKSPLKHTTSLFKLSPIILLSRL